jgi:hypothetical protein
MTKKAVVVEKAVEFTAKEVTSEVKRLLALKDEVLVVELRKLTNTNMAALGHASSELCTRVAAFMAKQGVKKS